jgi:hyperosmotically inducible periplasmic protein
MKNLLAVCLAVGIGAALLKGPGFAQQNAQQPRASVRSQDRIIKQIRTEIVMLPQYSVFDDIQYKVEGETVTLLGQVRNATLKSDAEHVVSDIEGIEKVDNRIEVLPLSNTDDQIRRAVYYALFAESSPLFRYGWGAVPPIHIIVNNGRVTLTGVVDSEGDKITAGMLAQKVSGIFSMTNNLTVAKT